MAKTAQRTGAWTVSPSVMMAVRQIHAYIGAFIAPSVLFFAFTGSLQLFSLHQAQGAYTPPAIVEMLSRVHKDQALHAKPRPKSPDADKGPARRAGRREAPEPVAWSVNALKWVFLSVAVALMTSTLLGLWMALTFSRRRAVVLALVAAGTVLPILLVVA